MPRPGLWQEIAAWDVPKGKVFWWWKVGVSYSPGAAGDMHFGILVDGKPLGPGLGDQTHQIGDLNFADMAEVQQRILGPAHVSVEAYLAAAGTHTAYARIYGMIGPDVPDARKGQHG